MRSIASIFAASLLLAGCAGHGGYANAYGETAAPVAGPRGSYQEPPADDRFAGARNAYGQPIGGNIDADLQSAPDYERPAAPGASYAQPGASYTQPGTRYSQPVPSYSQPAPAYAQQDGGYPQPAYPDPSAGMPGPRGTSQPSPGEERYDEVGYAGVRGVAGGDANGGAVVAVARGLQPGSYVEVTSLDTGRTILVLVTGSMEPGADHPIDLSTAAARQLGAQGTTIPVRVRRVNASPPDQAALRAGQPASERVDTPPVLLAALRRHLPASAPVPGYAATPSQPTRGTTAPRGGSGYYVQVGAFSNGANAQRLAQQIGGFVKPGGGLNRVQMGPYRTAGEAQAARARVAQLGYGDARVFTLN